MAKFAKMDTKEFDFMINKVNDNVVKGPKKVFIEFAEAIVEEAKRNAPRDTNFMANSISFRVIKTGVIVFVGAFYWIFVEFGTVKMSAQPFFFPAIEKFLPQIERALNNLVTKGVK